MISAPTPSPRPLTILINPAGRWALCTHSMISCVCKVLILLGFVTTVHPAASATDALLKKYRMASCCYLHQKVRHLRRTVIFLDEYLGMVVGARHNCIVQTLEILCPFCRCGFRISFESLFCCKGGVLSAFFIAKSDTSNHLLSGGIDQIEGLLAVRFNEFTVNVVLGDEFHIYSPWCVDRRQSRVLAVLE